MNIAFVDLKRQFSAMEPDIRAALDGVLAHARFIMGPEINQLEEQLARFAGVKEALTCASGTDALLLPLMAKGVGPGDAVFTTPFTFIATAEVISLLGATPVFVDVDPVTFNMDPLKFEAALNEVRTKGTLTPKAVIPVDIFGLPADYDPIMAVAQRAEMFVLEDAAQSFGGRYKDRYSGNLAHAGATSFFPAKPLGCYGDGGAIMTNDAALAELMRSFRVHGQGTSKYENVRIGVNARMDTMQAAILLVKLAALPREIETRQKVADRYNEGLEGYVETPAVPEGYSSAWAQYSVLTDHRDEIVKALGEAGVPTAIYYPIPLHLQKAFEGLNHRQGDFPVSESLAGRIFSLPVHPYMTDDEVDYVIEQVRSAVRGVRS